VPARASLVYPAYRWLWSSLDWLFPPQCGGCGQNGSRWCPVCQSAARRIMPPVCPICGQHQISQRLCQRCRQAPPHYTALRSWAVFDGSVRNALHRLKYKRDIALGEALSRHLLDVYNHLGWQVDLVVPVPLGVARQAERGYNQSALLAKPLALACGLPYYPRALRKTRETPSQVGLNLEQRWSNVAGSFEALPGDVQGRSVLVVDDVSTSGATLNACAQALADAGAVRVYGLTLARAE
jgi:competence protein ComFC